ncbi:MAG TPA: DUF1330 domain-containing protein [Stellaceae bacterium]|nr:DUF1330 domain-containing protein [Stellaceae bacterium]
MANAPAYVIVEVEVTDPAVFREYGAKAGPTLAAYNAKLIVRGKAQAKEGAIPVGNIVVIEFASLADAEAWYGSAAYKEIIPLRQRAANSRLFIVEGEPR